MICVREGLSRQRRRRWRVKDRLALFQKYSHVGAAGPVIPNPRQATQPAGRDDLINIFLRL